MTTKFNIADTLELAVDTYTDHEYLVCDGKRCTYREMEHRSNQLAHHLQSRGIKPFDHVGIYGLNSMEWVESMWAVFKMRSIYVNINYRFVSAELEYMFDNADLKAVIVERQFLPMIDALRACLPKLEHVIVIEDGTKVGDTEIDYIEYEAALAAQSGDRDFEPRSEDDHWMVYTGGTTGFPKGVVWRHYDVIFALGGGINIQTQTALATPEEIVAGGKTDNPMVVLSVAPLMHGATQWSCIGRGFLGEKVVLMRQFDADELWLLVEKEKVSSLFIVGDAMARPMIEAYEVADPKPDTSSLVMMVSSGAIFSPTVKDKFFEHFPHLFMIDSYGASEVGGNGMTIVENGKTAMTGGGPTVNPVAGTVVLNEETLEVIKPGDPTIGKVARTGYIPLEYYKDPEKSAATFVIGKDGNRYSMPGDFARAEADGRITMLGRGSVSINSGGEKIYPEEVEAAVKGHPAIYDCVVVGVPDDRWGSRVAAVALTRGDEKPGIEEIMDHCRNTIAGYKVPREIHYVNEIPRSPAGKANYAWAKSVATGEAL
jgi:acyl-CoA synthetase (AMP-forming)/AMP-acid ligase II